MMLESNPEEGHMGEDTQKNDEKPRGEHQKKKPVGETLKWEKKLFTNK